MLRSPAALLLTLALPVLADERLSQADFPTSHQQLERKNQAVLTYLWADVYAAAYYTAPGIEPLQAYRREADQRLELYYYRSIDRSDVIEAAWTTLERQLDGAALAALRPDLDALHATFRDIRAGDRYALNYAPPTGLSLERNGETLFRSDDPALARAYLGIWLAPGGLSDALREKLLAQR